MSSKAHIHCYHLPKSHPDPPTWGTLISKSRDLRLHSLSISPTAYGSSLDRELAFDSSVWESRLQNTSATTIVATESTDYDEGCNTRDELTTLLEKEWLGHIVLIQRSAGEGEFVSTKSPWPNGYAAKGAESAEKTAGENNVTTRDTPGLEFVLNAVFVRQEQRGKGIGKALVDAALSEANEIARAAGGGTYRVLVLVFEDNSDAAGLYRNAGFRETKAEQLDVKGVKRTTLTLELRKSSKGDFISDTK